METLMNKYLLNPTGHALVLGASGEIGSEIARSLAANGVKKLTLHYGRDKKRPVVEALAAELKTMGVATHIIQFTERTDDTEDRFRSQLDEAVAALGEEINIYADSIGISPNTPLNEQTIKSRVGVDGEHIPGWYEVVNINVFGAFLSARAMLNRMKEKGTRGSLVLITSTNGHNSWAPYSMPYDFSKAMAPIIQGFAFDFASADIRVNGVAPGWVDTDMNKTLPPGEREVETKKIWMGRWADPAEIANVVTFISGPGASFITGQNIIVDGGYR